MVVGEAHNILVVIEHQIAARGRHIYLWPETTRLYKSHVPTKIGTYGLYSLTTIRENVYENGGMSQLDRREYTRQRTLQFIEKK